MLIFVIAHLINRNTGVLVSIMTTDFTYIPNYIEPKTSLEVGLTEQVNIVMKELFNDLKNRKGPPELANSMLVVKSITPIPIIAAE